MQKRQPAPNPVSCAGVSVPQVSPQLGWLPRPRACPSLYHVLAEIPRPGVPAGSPSPSARCQGAGMADIPKAFSRCQPLGVSPPSAISLCSGAPATGDQLVARALAGSRAGCLGPHGSGGESSSLRDPPPASACFVLSPQPPWTGLTCPGRQPTPCRPVPPLSFISWDSDVFMRLGHKKLRGPLILLYDCFPMNYRRG